MDGADWQRRAAANRATSERLREATRTLALAIADTELALADTLEALAGPPQVRARRAALAAEARTYAAHLTGLAQRPPQAARPDHS